MAQMGGVSFQGDEVEFTGPQIQVKNAVAASQRGRALEVVKQHFESEGFSKIHARLLMVSRPPIVYDEFYHPNKEAGFVKDVDELSSFIKCVCRMEEYAANVLKPVVDSIMGKRIRYTDDDYQTLVSRYIGNDVILKLMGYKEDKEGFVYPSHNALNKETVINLTADLLILEVTLKNLLDNMSVEQRCGKPQKIQPMLHEQTQRRTDAVHHQQQEGDGYKEEWHFQSASRNKRQYTAVKKKEGMMSKLGKAVKNFFMFEDDAEEDVIGPQRQIRKAVVAADVRQAQDIINQHFRSVGFSGSHARSLMVSQPPVVYSDFYYPNKEAGFIKDAAGLLSFEKCVNRLRDYAANLLKPHEDNIAWKTIRYLDDNYQVLVSGYMGNDVILRLLGYKEDKEGFVYPTHTPINRENVIDVMADLLILNVFLKHLLDKPSGEHRPPEPVFPEKTSPTEPPDMPQEEEFCAICGDPAQWKGCNEPDCRGQAWCDGCNERWHDSNPTRNNHVLTKIVEKSGLKP